MTQVAYNNTLFEAHLTFALHLFTASVLKITVPKMSWHTEEGGIMCFEPTMDQFRNFSKFIEFMESKGAHKCGVAKVRFKI